ncbi:hypothetical protein A3Q56_05668 [Intoshia linei]|uniref:Uncharacterized protein n=1 Tax=Intoshia linei TaxID=1819745 RepID=A0A177AXL9_9BILA|nr:hypothetical protein A3Q56_05668 [Intoshia linei]
MNKCNHCKLSNINTFSKPKVSNGQNPHPFSVYLSSNDKQFRHFKINSFKEKMSKKFHTLFRSFSFSGKEKQSDVNISSRSVHSPLRPNNKYKEKCHPSSSSGYQSHENYDFYDTPKLVYTSLERPTCTSIICKCSEKNKTNFTQEENSFTDTSIQLSHSRNCFNSTYANTINKKVLDIPKSDLVIKNNLILKKKEKSTSKKFDEKFLEYATVKKHKEIADVSVIFNDLLREMIKIQEKIHLLQNVIKKNEREMTTMKKNLEITKNVILIVHTLNQG